MLEFIKVAQKDRVFDPKNGVERTTHYVCEIDEVSERIYVPPQ